MKAILLLASLCAGCVHDKKTESRAQIEAEIKANMEGAKNRKIDFSFLGPNTTVEELRKHLDGIAWFTRHPDSDSSNEVIHFIDLSEGTNSFDVETDSASKILKVTHDDKVLFEQPR